MDALLGYGTLVLQSLFHPANCVGNLGADILGAFGSFATCVGHNLVGAAGTVSTVGSAVAGIAG